MQAIVLVFFLNGAPIEFMGHYESANGSWQRMQVQNCLKVKRQLKRHGWSQPVTGSARYSCEMRNVTYGKSYDGKEIVVSIH
ncbi:MAG TPA: hypothetical protein DG048_04890 [Pseudoalteromonas sp.]|nr:hypothetical protein [Pseudoalteromonas sp.]|tara:strand:+ start:846 stop:1091 length:246 start_codon:yes stop_codon:yes gene_type:complete